MSTENTLADALAQKIQTNPTQPTNPKLKVIFSYSENLMIFIPKLSIRKAGIPLREWYMP